MHYDIGTLTTIVLSAQIVTTNLPVPLFGTLVTTLLSVNQTSVSKSKSAF